MIVLSVVLLIATTLTFKPYQSTITGKVHMLLYVPIVATLFVGAEAVAILSNRVTQINVQTRFMVDDNTWPPEQPTNFTPLLLIHHQGHRTPKEAEATAKLMHTGSIDKISDTSKATKEIAEILAPLEKSKVSSFILIEGAPGIGKSVLLKEIAYRWASKHLLQNFDLVLLVCLRDPSLQKINSVDDLLQLFCRGDKNAPHIVSACAQHLFANGGKNLTLLLDGYDEYPEHLQKSSLITDIIRHVVLPHCGLVVSSRPHASADLRKQATIRVDILGFTETERKHYIEQALADQPLKVKELTRYLHQQPSVDSICFIPFNMVILLYLYKLENSLPKNSIELYRRFVCSTICRHLSKIGKPLAHNITDLTDLSEPYNRVIRQLSKLSLEALNSNKLIFTLHEITAACPDIAAIPGAINGFGLLQAVEHFGLYAKTMTLSFVHFTIQEFLAAHYISHLSPNEELKVINENFWNRFHFNMFSLYVSHTKGQRSSFKTFLSGENTVIDDEFLEDPLKCLCLYRSFSEANDEMLCKTIEQADVFKLKEIKLRDTTLTDSDIECLSLFLTSSFNKEWERLDLYNCHIQDKGLNFLCRGLRHTNDVTINELRLDYNNLTTSSLISKLTVKCRVKILMINDNCTIGEDKELYSMLIDASNTLEQLYMYDTKLSSRGATNLFTALKDNNKLKGLYIDRNDITNVPCDAIATALEGNSCLVTLIMYLNPLSNETILNIVQCLENNNTLQLLGLPQCPQDIQENVRSSQEFINKMRENRGCQVKLEIKFSYV